MLADLAGRSIQAGALNKDLHISAASLHELIRFIAQELPRWRDDKERKSRSSETALTSQLCGYLNSAARQSNGWDFLQFRVEEEDEVVSSRKTDLVAAPCGFTIWIEGRRVIQYDTLLPIECKRLPTPKGRDRDEREYVTSAKSTTGGIQRYKAGVHGANHKLAAMIGYIQEGTPTLWHQRLANWITDLHAAGTLGWSLDDLLRSEHCDFDVSMYSSSHARINGLPTINLKHLWIVMA